MESVKKSIDKRALHKRKYESRVNERHMQTKEGKVDMCKALDASLVVTESSGTKFEEQNTSSSSGNDADANDADIKPVWLRKYFKIRTTWSIFEWKSNEAKLNIDIV
ncbi:hypothetical protein Tco_0733262 [Tanacetum coccineum]